MSTHAPLPVAGYTPQSEIRVELVNSNKRAEEAVLRILDQLRDVGDPRWLAIARTHLEMGFMAMNRAVFQPARIALPGDGAPSSS